MHRRILASVPLEDREPRTNFTARLGNNLLAYLVREQVDPALWRPALEVAIALLPVKAADHRVSDSIVVATAPCPHCGVLINLTMDRQLIRPTETPRPATRG